MQQEAPVSIGDIITAMPVPWEQRDLITAHDAAVRVARFEGAFPWHQHAGDEIFLCWAGSFMIEMADREPVTLGAGDLFAVAGGTDHRPVAKEPAYVLMIERPDTTQYGT